MMSTVAVGTARNRFPFTATQWQELEHQALAYKYMISGVIIPPDLLFTIKRSLDSSNIIIHQPQHSIGWNRFQMGFGGKIDPEPGRCRRTDGKKWRCSKEAYLDSKYCERHMHRGRNRSRKPVEVNITASTATTPTGIPISSITRTPTYTNPSSISQSLSSISPDFHHHNLGSISHNGIPFLYHHSGSPYRPPGIGNLSSQDHFHLESGPYSHSNKDYRNSFGHGMKEEVDEHAFFSENSGTMKSMSGFSLGDSWHSEPLTMGSPLAHSKVRTCSDHMENGYSYMQQLQNLSDTISRQQKQNQHDLPLKTKRDDEPQKVIHHFFDEWPPKNKDSTTQLSISMPNSSHDFFMTNNGK